MPLHMPKINKRDLPSLFSLKNILLFIVTASGLVLFTIFITLRVVQQQALRENNNLLPFCAMT